MQLHTLREKDSFGKDHEPVNTTEIVNLPTITAEIAAARRDLLIAARNTAASAVAAASAAQPPSPEKKHVRDGNEQCKRKDPQSNAWLVAPLESASVRSRDPPQTSEGDGMIKASLTRLDGRVRSLENQGVRSDRRSAELAGLAQALTEEQRALLIRLDRLEEQLRSGLFHRPSRDLADSGNLGGEGGMQRLERLEQDQRMASTNFKLIVSLLDETEQRHQQKLRSLEEKLESRLESLETCVNASTPTAAPSRPALTDSGKQNCSYGYDETFCNSIAGMDYKTAKSLKSAQDLLARCESSRPENGWENQENLDPRLGARRLESHSDAIKELQRRLDDLVQVSEAKESTREQQGLSLDELRSHIAALPTREEVVELGRAHEEHDRRLTTLCTKLELLATNDQVEVVRKEAESVQSMAISSIQSKLENLQGTHSECYQKVGERLLSLEASLQPLGSTLDKMQESQIELERQCVKDEACESGRQSLSTASIQQLLDLQQSVDSLRARLDDAGCEMHAVGTTCTDAVAQLQRKVDHMCEATDPQKALVGTAAEACVLYENSTSEVKHFVPKEIEAWVIPDLQNKMQDLQYMQSSCYKKLDESLESHEVSIKLLLSRLDNLYERQSEADAQRLHLPYASHLGMRLGLHENTNGILSVPGEAHAGATLEQMTVVQEAVDSQRARLDVLSSEIRIVASTCSDAVVKLQQHVQHTLDKGSGAEVSESVMEENADVIELSADVLPEFASKLRALQSEISSLQDKVEGQLVLRSLHLDQQMPEALRQIERLSQDCVTCATKVEEHEVRLGLAWTKQLANEEKINGFMTRVEQQLGVAKLRTICREEWDARAACFDFAELAKRLELTMDAVAELDERVHSRDTMASRNYASDSPVTDDGTVTL